MNGMYTDHEPSCLPWCRVISTCGGSRYPRPLDRFSPCASPIPKNKILALAKGSVTVRRNLRSRPQRLEGSPIWRPDFERT